MSELYFDTASYPEEARAIETLAPTSGTSILGIDLTRPAEGIAQLIASRRAGMTNAVFPILPDPFEATLATIFRSIVASPNIETRSTQMDALRSDGLLVNEKKPSEFATLSDAHRNAAQLALRLADVVLIAAPGEQRRWDGLLERPLRQYALLPVSPATPGGTLDESAVTIYAPTLGADDIAFYVALLHSRRIPTREITQANSRDAITTSVVFTPEWRPMRSRELAAAGHRVIAPDVWAPQACDARIFGYAPIDYRAMLDAVDAAFGTELGSTTHPSTPPETVTQALSDAAARTLDGPRVSIIVRTYDRPALLARAVASLAVQSHRDLEIVVVNNGGDDVRSIVDGAAKGRRVRYEVMPERKHISAASNVGARAATGTFIGYLDDDDLLYADHCARTTEALERTKADLAFTMCLGEYAKMDGDAKHVLGYQVYLDRAFHTDDVYIANITPIHSIVHARSLFDRFGFFDEKLPVTDDWELWLRAVSGGARLLRIDRVTCEYSWRYDPKRGNMTIKHQRDFVDAYGEIAERYAADVVGRPSILGQQRHMYESQQERAANAADPTKAASIVISTMSETMVPVAPVPDPS